MSVSLNGPTRSTDADATQYALVCPTGLKRLAETYAEGATKYAPDNWALGLPINDTLNHVLRHLNEYRLGNEDEDHLAHAAWGLFTLMHLEDKCLCHVVREIFKARDTHYKTKATWRKN